MTDRYEKIDAAELWFQDGLRIMGSAEFFAMDDVDMQATQEIIAALREQGIKCTYTHVIARATAVALARHPEINRLMLGKKFVYLDTVDIGLPVSTELGLTVQPTIVLRNADQKQLVELAKEMIQRAPEVRARDVKRVALLRKLARFFRFSWMRRSLLRSMMSKVSSLRERNGTFHITCVPHIRQGITFKSPTRSSLTVSRVEDRVVVRDGQPAVRPMTTLGFSAHNHTWNGNTAAILLNEIKKILEEGELAEEAGYSGLKR